MRIIRLLEVQRGMTRARGMRKGFVESVSQKKVKLKGGKALHVWPLLFSPLKISKIINKEGDGKEKGIVVSINNGNQGVQKARRTKAL